ncbi:hypothetical protein ABID08_002364 [Rhizobium binae]|uniref:Uncharacterized protein n=1 Tax=Rhizobium binae TaxID=1138190 RepID=A0ABV2MEW7_9HYPH
MADLAGMPAFPAAVAMKDDSALFRPQEPGDNAQQSRLSGSISPRQHKRLAGRQVKGKINENEIVTAPCGQIFGGEMHASILSSFRLAEESKNVRI